MQTTSGISIDLEAQQRFQRFFDNRLAYYTGRMYVDRLQSGDPYDKLTRAISIVVADFPLIPNDACHNCFRLYDPRTRTAYPECLEIHTLEIPKRQMGDTSPLSQWLHFFAAHTEEEFMSLARINPVMERAWGVIKEFSADEEARLQAEAQEKFRRDMDAMYKTGHFDGRAEGFADGEAKGFADGEARRSRDIAANLLQLGLPLEQIAPCTSLSVDQVRELSRQ